MHFLTDLVALNFVVSEWDPYSSWFLKEQGYIDPCPHYIQTGKLAYIIVRPMLKLHCPKTFESLHYFLINAYIKWLLLEQFDLKEHKILLASLSEILLHALSWWSVRQ